MYTNKRHLYCIIGIIITSSTASKHLTYIIRPTNLKACVNLCFQEEMLSVKEESAGADHHDQQSKGVVEHADPRRVEYEGKTNEQLIQILLNRDARVEQVQFSYAYYIERHRVFESVCP